MDNILCILFSLFFQIIISWRKSSFTELIELSVRGLACFPKCQSKKYKSFGLLNKVKLSLWKLWVRRLWNWDMSICDSSVISVPAFCSWTSFRKLCEVPLAVTLTGSEDPRWSGLPERVLCSLTLRPVCCVNIKWFCFSHRVQRRELLIFWRWGRHSGTTQWIYSKWLIHSFSTFWWAFLH